MKKTVFTRLIAGLIITAIAITAYSRNEITSSSQFQPNPVTKDNTHVLIGSILNQNLSVTYARDGGTDITEDMNDWTFRFVGNHPSGEAQAWNDIMSATGMWSMAEGSSTINIAYYSKISQLVFMSREWTIGQTNKGAEIVLTAADGDEVHLISDVQ
jgi:hypothetical protein